jgi:hypothetical protein
MADKKVIIGLQVNSGNSVQNIEAVRDAAKSMGDVGATAGNRFAQALENIQREQDRVNKKVTEGRLVTEKDGKAIIQQFDILREVMEEIERTTGALPAEFQAAFQTAAKQVSETTTRVANLSDGVADQAGLLKEGQAQWRGFGNELNAVLGPMGKFQAGAIAGFAALQQGWQIGTEIAKALGTDFQAMNETMDAFKEKAKVVNSSILSWLSGAGSFADLRASLTLTKTEFEGYNSALIAGVKDLGNYKEKTAELNEIAAAHAIILAEGIEGQRLANQAKVDGNGVLDNYIVALNVASDAAKVHHELAKQGAEGDRLWAEIREKGKGSVVDLAAAIKSYGDEIAELTGKTKAQIAAEKALQDALNDTDALTLKRLEHDKQQAELINRQTQEENKLTDQIRAKIAEIIASLAMAEGRGIPLAQLQIKQLQELIALGPKLTDAEREQLNALLEKLKAIEKLNGMERERLVMELQASTALAATAEATGKVTEASIKWSDATKSGKLSAEEAAEAMKNLREQGLALSKESLDDHTKSLTAVSDGYQNLNETLNETVKRMRAVREEAEIVGKALADAAAKALGQGGEA